VRIGGIQRASLRANESLPVSVQDSGPRVRRRQIRVIAAYAESSRGEFGARHWAPAFRGGDGFVSFPTRESSDVEK